MANTNLKSIKKGDKVILHLFTGAYVDSPTVAMADAKKIGFTNKKGIKMVFDKATGKQLEPKPKSDRFANFITEYDAKFEKEALAKRSGKGAAKAPAKAKAKTEVTEEKPKTVVKKRKVVRKKADVEELD